MLEQEQSTLEIDSSDSDEDVDAFRQFGALKTENQREDRVIEKSPRGRFIRFNRKLGSGAFKSVYLGFDNDTGREVAWNVVSIDRLSKHEKRRLDEEIRVVSAMNSPRIIKFISAWINKEKREVVFITERVSGGSLRAYIRRLNSPLKLKVIRNWCRQILEGLVYLHSFTPQPIIHRDLKCDNIFVDGHEGNVVIGDLGLCTPFSATTMHRSLVGTPECMAPEIYDEHYGIQVDIYAFGMCLLEMISHRPPYVECSGPGQIYKRVVSGTKPRDVDLIRNLELKRIVMACLSTEPGDRPTADQLLGDAFWTDDKDGDELVDLVNVKCERPASEPLISLDLDSELVPSKPVSIVSNQGEELHSIQRKQSISVAGDWSSSGSYNIPSPCTVPASSCPASITTTPQCSTSSSTSVDAIGRMLGIKRIDNVSIDIGESRITFDYVLETDTPVDVARQLVEVGLVPDNSDMCAIAAVINTELMNRMRQATNVGAASSTASPKSGGNSCQKRLYPPPLPPDKFASSAATPTTTATMPTL
jgi:WNK lysine deficient protein kinase